MRKCCICGKEVEGAAIMTLVSVIDPEVPEGRTSQFHYCRQCAPNLTVFDGNPKEAGNVS